MSVACNLQQVHEGLFECVLILLIGNPYGFKVYSLTEKFLLSMFSPRELGVDRLRVSWLVVRSLLTFAVVVFPTRRAINLVARPS
jgi:hypothetical protein